MGHRFLNILDQWQLDRFRFFPGVESVELLLDPHLHLLNEGLKDSQSVLDGGVVALAALFNLLQTRFHNQQLLTFYLRPE